MTRAGWKILLNLMGNLMGCEKINGNFSVWFSFILKFNLNTGEEIKKV